jgi:hypothetical protein
LSTSPNVEEAKLAADDLDPGHVLGQREHRVATRVRLLFGIAAVQERGRVPVRHDVEGPTLQRQRGVQQRIAVLVQDPLGDRHRVLRLPALLELEIELLGALVGPSAEHAGGSEITADAAATINSTFTVTGTSCRSEASPRYPPQNCDRP